MHDAGQGELLFGGGVFNQGLDEALDSMQPSVDGDGSMRRGWPLIGRLRWISANHTRLSARPTSATGSCEPRSPEKSRESFEPLLSSWDLCCACLVLGPAACPSPRPVGGPEPTIGFSHGCLNTNDPVSRTEAGKFPSETKYGVSTRVEGAAHMRRGADVRQILWGNPLLADNPGLSIEDPPSPPLLGTWV